MNELINMIIDILLFVGKWGLIISSPFLFMLLLNYLPESVKLI